MVARLSRNEGEAQRKGRRNGVQCLLVVNVCFLSVFNFALLFVLGAVKVFAGQLHAGTVCGMLKVIDEVTVCHCGKGKAIING